MSRYPRSLCIRIGMAMSQGIAIRSNNKFQKLCKNCVVWCIYKVKSIKGGVPMEASELLLFMQQSGKVCSVLC